MYDAGDASHHHRDAEGERVLLVLEVGFAEAARMIGEQVFQSHVFLRSWGDRHNPDHASQCSARVVTARWGLRDISGANAVGGVTVSVRGRAAVDALGGAGSLSGALDRAYKHRYWLYNGYGDCAVAFITEWNDNMVTRAFTAGAGRG